jgi:quinol-cytochrome oxidoreductase complex cytochrome b subunit
MVAVLTFGVAMIADLSGRLLPWDARGYWTMIRAREVFDELPIIGPLSTFLVGGTGLDSLILTRFYVLHILTLPFLLLALFYVHFSSVRRVGLSKVDAAPAVTRPLKVAMYDVVLIVLFLVGGLVTLTVLWPHPFDVVADPLVTPPNSRPPLYLLAPHALQEMMPAIMPAFIKGLFLEGLVAVVLLLPFIDRSGGTGPRRKLVLALGLLACVVWVVLTWWGWRLEVAR